MAMTSTAARTGARRRTRGEARTAAFGWSALRWAVIAGAMATTIVPVYWLVTTSFKQQVDYLAYPPKLIPSTWTLDGYRVLFKQNDLWHYFANSVVITLTSTALAVFLGPPLRVVCARHPQHRPDDQHDHDWPHQVLPAIHGQQQAAEHHHDVDNRARLQRKDNAATRRIDHQGSQTGNQ